MNCVKGRSPWSCGWSRKAHWPSTLFLSLWNLLYRWTFIQKWSRRQKTLRSLFSRKLAGALCLSTGCIGQVTQLSFSLCSTELCSDAGSPERPWHVYWAHSLQRQMLGGNSAHSILVAQGLFSCALFLRMVWPQYPLSWSVCSYWVGEARWSIKVRNSFL